MPLRIALRDKPHARLTRVTPPQPKAFASLAAISRRLRSSKCGQRSRNFSDNSVTVIILLKHNLDQSPIQVTNLVPLFISVALAVQLSSLSPHHPRRAPLKIDQIAIVFRGFVA